MYDIIFYTNESSLVSNVKLAKEKYPFAKIIKFDSTLSKTAFNAKKLSNTKFFWLINIDYSFKDEMLEFIPDVNDLQYIHVFYLDDSYKECYLISKNHKITEVEDILSPLKYNKEYVIKELYDIFFLTFEEPNSEENWKILSSKFPRAQKVNGVNNIYLSHKNISKLAKTDYFWVVDGDSCILDNFNFEFTVPEYDFDSVHVWYSRNEINDLEYGNGGIKLFPKFLFDSELNGVDITTGLNNKIKVIPIVASINKFAASPWDAWRSAFRECAKLSSLVIDNSNKEENDQRLKAWTTIGLEKKYGKYVLAGARDGMNYGIENKKSPSQLIKINDWEWLKLRFKNKLSEISNNRENLGNH